MNQIADDPEPAHSLATFVQRLQQLGWTDGRNVQIDTRWAAGDADRIRRYTVELVALAPEVIVVTGTAAMAPMLQATRTVPIVFANIADPVGAGFVDSMARPGGNATGFIQFEYSVSGKWLELLKELAPRVTRTAVIRDSALTSGIGQFAVIQSVAPSVGVEVSPVSVRDAGEIERAVTAFARPGNGGLILTASALSVVHRDLIIALAARHKLPAVYYRRAFVTSGGLISYGYDVVDQYRGCSRLCRSHPQGREARRPAGAGPDQIRARDQPQGREGTRARRAAVSARPRRRGDRINRRALIALLGGAATAWPLAAPPHAVRAQQGEPMRRIGVLIPIAANTPDAQANIAAFLQGLQQAGWTDGRNVRIIIDSRRMPPSFESREELARSNRT